ncbi:sporulation protein YunB [Ornithinibacillus gellani]|nr:sporulation protein YunB [Ornithinibacillus gellani]
MLRRRYGFKRAKGPPPASTVLMVSFFLFAAMVVFSIWLIDRGIKPTLMEIAQVKTTEFATRGINSAVKFAENYEFGDIAILTRNNEGYISDVDWNSSVVNTINRAATDRVEEFFHSMNRGEPPNYENPLDEPKQYGDTVDELVERDPTVVEIPLGQATKNTVFANLGPKIPVNLELVGSVRTELIDEREVLGINNVYVSLYVEVEADVQIVIPFTTELTTVSTRILIGKQLVMGAVPDFYGGGGGPSIAVPKEDLKGE